MTRKEELKAVLKYRDGDFRVGEGVKPIVAAILGVRHPFTDLDVDRASERSVRSALSHLRSYVLHMRKHPVRECPCCGTVVRVESIAEGH